MVYVSVEQGQISFATQIRRAAPARGSYRVLGVETLPAALTSAWHARAGEQVNIALYLEPKRGASCRQRLTIGFYAYTGSHQGCAPLCAR